MPFEVKELHPVFAAQVTGLPVTSEVAPDAVEFLEDAMAKYAVVVLPAQFIDDQTQVEFAKFFGPRETPAVATSLFGNKTRLPKYLFDASNVGMDGEILPADHPRRAIRKGDLNWHSDASFNPVPTKWSMLHGRIVPPHGANTEFCDMRAAYDALSAEMKAKVDKLVALHVWWHSREKGGFDQVTEAQRQANPPVYHPVVRTVARSNRKSLYLGAPVKSIVGMSDAESAELIDELTAHCTQPQFVYSHFWHAGDLVIWDNRCTMHRATPFDDMLYKRDMRRTTVVEYAPNWAAVG